MSVGVQQPAPPFSAQAMVDGKFKKFTLSDYRGKYLILIFYPLDFTFVCPTELLAFNEALETFRGVGAEIVGVSIDSEYTHLAWWNTPISLGGIQGLRFPLLADLTKTISQDYGVLLDSGVALRGLFVIDPQGIVRHCTINDLPIGRSVEEVLRIIQALQFHEANGDVCPANWKPGSATIKPDPEGSKEYFANGSLQTDIQVVRSIKA